MKNLFLVLTCFLTATLLAQKKDAVTLEWKIALGDTLSYKCVMTSIEESEAEFDTSVFNSVLPDSLKKKISKDSVPDFKKMLNAMKHASDDLNLVSRMTNNGNGIIGVYLELNTEKQEAKEQNDSISNTMTDLMGAMTNNIMLRGSVYKKGGIHSFWVKSSQKNLIAMFFELPKTPVKKGDSWPIEINYIGNDQNFECTESYRKNKVTLTDIKKAKDGTIAVLEYDIEEYVRGNFGFFGTTTGDKTMMKFTLHATAEFSIEKGRWLSYEGILESDSTGFMTGKTKKRIALIPQ